MSPVIVGCFERLKVTIVHPLVHETPHSGFSFCGPLNRYTYTLTLISLNFLPTVYEWMLLLPTLDFHNKEGGNKWAWCHVPPFTHEFQWPVRGNGKWSHRHTHFCQSASWNYLSGANSGSLFINEVRKNFWQSCFSKPNEWTNITGY